MANRRDRDTDKTTWRELPEQIDAESPAWPLSRATQRELLLWSEEWRRPQAIVWREMGVEREVALYVRTLRKAESPGAPATLTTLARQFMDALGISLDGMLRKRWRIGSIPAATSPAVRHDDPDRASAKSRFQSIEGGAARGA